MAFSNLFRRYSTSTEIPAASYAFMNESSTAETLLDELESQCRNCSSLLALKEKRHSQVYNQPPPSTTNTPYSPNKRHSSVDYSWLTPNKNLLQATNDIYHLSDIIKMELSELIGNVLPEDCTLIINEFRKEIRLQNKSLTPESTIALFRKTIADYIDQKSKNRSNTTNNHLLANISANSKSTFIRNNRINPKYEPDDEQNCIAELTEISITSSSNDGIDNQTKSHA